ncbi:MFS transporter [Actinokineospora fastidiosa]|uniref:MFS transporter n=1 Tax=Actinokineospora fastidiosa TaxID=1816 RepID=A0A918GL88_9PSEU|nr:MFS transporter [Actinokineospora fastidiosa]GGS44921.1 MFS transporter [Actinokineospora fastidiosa]
MRSERVSVFIVFVLNGVIAGSWAPRIPTLAEKIGASPGVLGLVLLGASIGLAVSASFAGRLCARFGARVVVFASALAAAGMLPVLAVVTTAVQLGIALVVLGAAFGVFDVSMNVAALTVIRRVERPLMPVFHAGFSFGGLAGSLSAALAAGYRVELLPYFTTVMVASVIVIAGVIRFVPREEPAADTRGSSGLDRGLMRRPVLWLLGGIAFVSAIVEGSNADWSALFAVHERGMSEAAGALMYSVFAGAMAVVRLLGEPVQRRFDAVRILAVGSLLAGTGLLTAAIVPVAWLTYVGYVVAGAGVAFVFPLVIELAGAAGQRDDGNGGAREVGFVTSIAYSGFLIGPPMLGGVAELTDLSFAVGFVGLIAMLIAPAALAASAARKREQARGPLTEHPRTPPSRSTTSSSGGHK